MSAEDSPVIGQGHPSGPTLQDLRLQHDKRCVRGCTWACDLDALSWPPQVRAMENVLEILSLPGLVVCIVIGTIILSRLDARAARKILEANKSATATGDDAPS